MGHLHRRDRLGERTDLVDLHEDAVGHALGNTTGEPLGVGDKQVVAHELHLLAELLRDQLPALPVILRAAVFDRHDRVPARQVGEKVDHAGGVERLALDRVGAALGVVHLGGSAVEGDGDLLTRLVAGVGDRGEDHLQRLGTGADVRGEAPLVTDGRGKFFILEHLFQSVEGLDAGAEGLVEGVEAQGHHHKLLHVERIVGVGTAIDDVHHRRGQQPGRGAAEIAVERQAAVLGRRVGHGERNAEDRVRAQHLLVGRAVEFEHQFVDGRLVEGIAALQFVSDAGVDALDGLQHALAQIHARVAVPLLPGLVGAGARPRWNRGTTARAVGQGDVDLNRRIAAAVENLAGVDVDNRGHEDLKEGVG